MWVKIREVVESPKFEKSKRAIEADARRLDEALDGITFQIARYPERGKMTDKEGIRGIATNPWGMKSMVIYYSYNEIKVVLEDIRIADLPSEF